MINSADLVEELRERGCIVGICLPHFERTLCNLFGVFDMLRRPARNPDSCTRSGRRLCRSESNTSSSPYDDDILSLD
jgi:hypothetical protein